MRKKITLSMKKFLLLICFFLAPFCVVAEAAKKQDSGAIEKIILGENSFYDKLSSDVVTPHIAWALPYYNGALRVLLLAPAAQRETVELAQRLDMEYYPLMCNGYDKINFAGGSETVQQLNFAMEQTFHERLATEYDLIIIGKMSWQSLPDFVRSSIMRKVENGTGLLYICPRNHAELAEFFSGKSAATEAAARAILATVPVESLPVLKQLNGDKLLSLSTIGKGRVAKVEYGQGLPFRTWHFLTPDQVYSDNVLHYEYYHSFLAKVAIWAGGKEAEINLGKITVDNSLLQCSVASKEKAKTEFLLEVRDSNNEIQCKQEFSMDLQPGENRLVRQLPTIKNGLHFLDLWVKKDGKIVNWGSTSNFFERGNSLEEILLDKTAYKTGETIKGSVSLKHAPARKTKCKIQLLDNFSRVISEKTIAAQGEKLPFSLVVKQAFSLLLRVRVELIDADAKVICSAEKEITVPQKTHDDFYFLMWAWSIKDADSYIARLLLKQFYEYGVDYLFDSPPVNLHRDNTYESMLTRSKISARANLPIVPYMFALTTRYDEDKGVETDLRRSPCFTDEQYRAGISDCIKASVPLLMTCSPSVYSLSINGEVGFRKDYCFSESCLESFRRYLKKNYQTLQALNQEWNRNFTVWNEIRPLTFEEAKEENNFPPWVDHRLHMEEVYAEFVEYCRAGIRSIDPDALVGIDESRYSTSFSGFNWWRLANSLDYLGSYTYSPILIQQKEFCRSFMKKKPGFSGLWMGSYNRSDEYNRYIPWQTLFSGMNSVWWWMGYNNDINYTFPALDAGFKKMPFYAHAQAEISEIKSGLGKLLLSCQREHDKIAVHYSPVSLHASTIIDGPDKTGSFTYSLLDFKLAVEDLGLQFEFVAKEQIEAGWLQKNECKILFLPCARALSAQETVKIKDFVKDGGMLIADVKPAEMDEHCKKLSENPLQEVFAGFTKSLGLNQYGEGSSVWIDNLLQGYHNKRLKGKTGETAVKLREIFRAGNVAARLQVLEHKTNMPLEGVETVFFSDREVQYACVLRDYGLVPDLLEKEVTIKWSGKKHAYDSRKGEYLGLVDSVVSDIPAAGAKVYALMPYQIESLQLKLNKNTFRQGEEIRFKIKVKSAAKKMAKHVFRMELIDPDGENHRHYGENLLAEKGEFFGRRFLALNEKKGNWKIIVKDVASGKSCEKHFLVQ